MSYGDDRVIVETVNLYRKGHQLQGVRIRTKSVNERSLLLLWLWSLSNSDTANSVLMHDYKSSIDLIILLIKTKICYKKKKVYE